MQKLLLFSFLMLTVGNAGARPHETVDISFALGGCTFGAKNVRASNPGWHLMVAPAFQLAPSLQLMVRGSYCGVADSTFWDGPCSDPGLTILGVDAGLKVHSTERLEHNSTYFAFGFGIIRFKDKMPEYGFARVETTRWRGCVSVALGLEGKGSEGAATFFELRATAGPPDAMLLQFSIGVVNR